MKKLFLFVLALLIMSGVSFAAGIPLATDPQNGPEIWTVEVFNDANTDLVSGDVVVWDYTDSDMANITTRKMYVTTTTTADDIATAGVVVSPTIVNQSVGAIAIWGPVKAKVTGTVTAGTAIGTSATAKKCTGYANTGNDDGVLGWSVAATTDATQGGGADVGIVFVKPTVMAD